MGDKSDDLMAHDDFEVAARRAKFNLVLAAQDADGVRRAEIARIDADEIERRPQAVAILDDFVGGGDLEAFRTAMDKWTRKQPPTSFNGFGGFSGQMSTTRKGCFVDWSTPHLAQTRLPLPSRS
jgi:hypothetical protein